MLPLAVGSFGLSLVRGPACVCMCWPGFSCIYLALVCVGLDFSCLFFGVFVCAWIGLFLVGSPQIGANSGTFIYFLFSV